MTTTGAGEGAAGGTPAKVGAVPSSTGSVGEAPTGGNRSELTGEGDGMIGEAVEMVVVVAGFRF